MVIRYYVVLARGDGAAHEHAEAHEKRANHHIEEETDAEHPDQQAVEHLVLRLFVLQLIHIVGEKEPGHTEENENPGEHIGKLNKELIVLRQK